MPLPTRPLRTGPSRFASGRRALQSLRARANTKRTRTQKIADWLISALGSNVFLTANLLWFAGWAVINLGWIPGVAPFDPFPFTRLTMVVSLEAILLSILVLAAQNRTSHVDQLRQEIDLQINLIAEEELTKLLSLVARIAERQGIDVTNDRELREMVSPTNVEKIERVLESELHEPQTFAHTKDSV